MEKKPRRGRDRMVVGFTGKSLWTGHSIPLFPFFSFHFHGLEICKTAIICRFLIA